MTASAATSPSTGAATLPEGEVNVGIAQAYEIQSLGSALQELAKGTADSLMNIQLQLGSFAAKSCHCPHVDKLTQEMSAAGTASRQASTRIGEMEGVLRKLLSDGAPLKQPPGFVPGASSFPASADAGRGEPYTTMFMNRTSYRVINDLDKLFDEKASSNAAHSYSGDTNEGVKWHKTVRGYFISRNKVLSPILDFIEKHELKEVTLGAMQAECDRQGWMIEDLERLSEVLWGFLNGCLKGSAKETFELADDLDGFNAWRRVVQDIRKSRNIRLAQTRRAVRNPPAVKDTAHIGQAVKNFDAIHKAYKDAGGTIQDDQEKRSTSWSRCRRKSGSSFSGEWSCRNLTPSSATCPRAPQTPSATRMVSMVLVVGYTPCRLKSRCL